MTIDPTLLQIEARAGATDLDLSHFDFERLSSGDDLVFSNCRFDAARLSGEALAASTWINCTFSGAAFASADLRDARFQACRFYNATEVQGSSFQFCTLTRAAFVGCDVSLSAFNGCEAHEITFTECQMRGAQFDRTVFAYSPGRKRAIHATFDRCGLRDALFDGADLTACRFTDCDMTGIALRDARLINAALRNCTVMAPQMVGADLSGADLRGSTLNGVNLAELRACAGMKVSAGQQHFLLNSLGITVDPN